MINYKRVIGASILLTFTGLTWAQITTNSPYTRYGYGQLSDQSFGQSKAMGGIAYGLRNGLQINASNPASYSAVDSLTFLFDTGLSLQNANFKEGDVRTNAKNSSIDYIAAQFRLRKGLGLTVGFLPYSSVGYNMYKSKEISTDSEGNTDISVLDTYSAEGGLHQVFAGVGVKLFENLSIGANISYLYGTIQHSVTTQFSQSDAYSSIRMDVIEVNDYKLDLGLQYTQRLNSKNHITLGAVYSYGHTLNSTGAKYIQKYSSSAVTQTADTIKNAFSIPHTFGAGITYVHNNRLTLGFDYTLQKWADAKFYDKTGYFTDRAKYAFGAEYLPNPISNNYLKRIRYRMGAYYSDPYAKVDGKEGAREYGISAGFGLPIFQSKSILSISGEYTKVSPKIAGMLEENYLKINVGLTFNERWFMKWKVE
ncbi:MAG: hypothetical protein ACRC3Z_08125 [Phocaeicola sp.]